MREVLLLTSALRETNKKGNLFITDTIDSHY